MLWFHSRFRRFLIGAGLIIAAGIIAFLLKGYSSGHGSKDAYQEWRRQVDPVIQSFLDTTNTFQQELHGSQNPLTTRQLAVQYQTTVAEIQAQLVRIEPFSDRRARELTDHITAMMSSMQKLTASIQNEMDGGSADTENAKALVAEFQEHQQEAMKLGKRLERQYAKD